MEEPTVKMSLSFSDETKNITNKTNDVDFKDTYHVKYLFQSLGVVLAMIMISSVLFNAFAFQHVIRQTERGKKFVHILMASLFVSNFFMAGLGYPIGILSMNNIHTEILLSHPYCHFSAYTVFASAVVSITHIVVLSVHRYLQFSQPSLSKTMNQKKMPALIIVFLAWLAGFTCTAFPFLGWGRFAVSGYTCSLDFTQRTIGSFAYVAYCMLMFYILPICVLIRTRFKITVRHASSFNRLPMRTQKRYANMEAAMLIGFLVCWTPFALVGLVTLASIDISVQIEQTCAVFAKSSALINSVIYCFFHKLCSKRSNAKETNTLRRWKVRSGEDVIMHLGSVHQDVQRKDDEEKHTISYKDEDILRYKDNDDSNMYLEGSKTYSTPTAQVINNDKSLKALFEL